MGVIKRVALAVLACVLLCLGVSPAVAQQLVLPCYSIVATQQSPCQFISTTNPLPVTPGSGSSFGLYAQGSTTSGQLGDLNQGAVTTGAPTYSTGTTNPLSLDTAGNLRVTGGVAQGSTTSGETGSLVFGAVLAADPTYVTAQSNPPILRTNGHLVTEQGPSALAASGIASVISASAENSHVLKNAAGNLYSVYATNLTASAGFLVVLNATSAPGDGAITPLDCVPLPASGNAAINYRVLPKVYSTGITAVVTSATTCFTKTTGVITAFISGDAQ